MKHYIDFHRDVSFDATSGVSGAGRKADLAYAFCETDEAFKPYGAVGHRHTTEISEQCSFIVTLPDVGLSSQERSPVISKSPLLPTWHLSSAECSQAST